MRKRTLLTAGFFLMISSTIAFAYSSDFTSGIDGWQPIYSPSAGYPAKSSPPVQFDSGSIYLDQVTGYSQTYFYKGGWNSWGSLYGGTISFDAKVAPYRADAVFQALASSIVLDVEPGSGGISSLLGKLEVTGFNTIGNWFHCSIRILDENFETDAVFGTVSNSLSGIAGILIRANLTDAQETVWIDNVTVSPVPEPATMLLLGAGLIGMAGYGRRKLS